MTRERNESSPDSSEDFEVISTPGSDQHGLAMRTKHELQESNNKTSLSISFTSVTNASEGDRNVVVSVIPPQKPNTTKDSDMKHVPCDIVLVIDVSGSMNEQAPLPDIQNEAEKEDSGLSILDLTKHAARTIIHTLDERDRLGVVTFSTDSKVIQPLTSMDKDAKEQTLAKIEKLCPLSSTNLWSGIKSGLQLFTDAPSLSDHTNVQGMYVLTDGQPNHMNPPQGYVKKLKPMLEKMADERGGFGMIPTIHTFGFGYHIRSELMMSIAEVGHGNYAFIPDAGMIGTVFVHAVANLQTTFATGTTLTLQVQDGSAFDDDSKAAEKKSMFSFMKKNAQNVQNAVEVHPRARIEADVVEHASGKVVLRLGNLLYGQSRDVVVRLETSLNTCCISAQLEYKTPSEGNGRDSHDYKTTTKLNISESKDLKKGQMTGIYHAYRAELCEQLTKLFPLRENGEHITAPDADVKEVEASMREFAERVQNKTNSLNEGREKEDMLSLVHDLLGPDPTTPGQILTALNLNPQSQNGAVNGNPPPPYVAQPPRQVAFLGPAYWRRWGRHYLPSILHAHARQMCNSFKDPGPLRYGIDSPLFIKCRDELDAAFESLPAPKPSLMVARYSHAGAVNGHGSQNKTAKMANFSMARYHSSRNPCFDGACPIKIDEAGKVKRVEELRVGDSVWTPQGEKQVATIVRTKNPCMGSDQVLDRKLMQPVCRIGNLLVTPWHPIKYEGLWTFPAMIAEEVVMSCNDVYSILLEACPSVEAHAVEVGGVTCVTLGHGMVQQLMGRSDPRAHGFFGDYDAVSRSLSQLEADENGHLMSGGVTRDAVTDLVCGFAQLDADFGERIEGPFEGKAQATHEHSLQQVILARV